MPRTIAIDGPVASGKSAVGSLVAGRLGYRFLDTGAMYRALTWFILQRGVDATDRRAVARLVARTTLRVDYSDDEESYRILVNGSDATPHLREQRVDRAVPYVSRVPSVRRKMVGIQRRIAMSSGTVVAGRDIGTVVFPDADLRIFLSASVEERAKRRFMELQRDRHPTSLEEVVNSLRERDRLDTERRASPLKPTLDATIINTDGLSVQEVVNEILRLASFGFEEVIDSP